MNRLEFAGELRNPVAGHRGRAVGQRLAGNFRIDAPDLATLWPDFAGQVRGTGKLGGTTARPSLDLDLTGSNLAAGDLQIGSLQARGGIGARQQLALDIESGGLSWSQRPLGDLSLGIAGTLGAQTVQAGLAGGDVEVQPALDRLVPQWSLHPDHRLRSGHGLWQRPVDVARAGNGPGRAARRRGHGPLLDLGRHGLCLTDLRSDPRGFSGGLDLRNFSLARLSPWLPADIGVGGTAAAALAVRSDGGRLTGSLTAGTQDAVITWRVPDDEDVETRISEFRVSAELADDVLAFDASLAEGFGLQLTTTGRVTAPFGETPTIVASLHGGVPDLAALGPVVERLVDVGDVQGRGFGRCNPDGERAPA